MIWGHVEPTYSRTMNWAETVLTIQNFPKQLYYHKLNGFDVKKAEIIDTFVLTPQGALNIYPPDYQKIIFKDGYHYHLYGFFYVNN